MLDLNVNIVAATDSTFCDEEDQAEMVIMEVPEASRSTPMEDSGSSNSSVVNAEFNRELEDSNSNSNTTATTTTTTEALIFDILKKEKDGLYMDRVASPLPGFVTRSFFPVVMDAEKGGIGRWVNSSRGNQGQFHRVRRTVNQVWFTVQQFNSKLEPNLNSKCL